MEPDKLVSAEEEHILACRVIFAPSILAALMSASNFGNDDRQVARAVSLSDKLARAIVAQAMHE